MTRATKAVSERLTARNSFRSRLDSKVGDQRSARMLLDHTNDRERTNAGERDRQQRSDPDAGPFQELLLARHEYAPDLINKTTTAIRTVKAIMFHICSSITVPRKTSTTIHVTERAYPAPGAHG